MQPARRFCPKPFEQLSIHAEGVARVCCHDWLPTAIGSLADGSLPEVWNSEQAQAVRQSILDGSFRYCRAEVCPDLVAGTLPTQAQVSDPFLVHAISRGLTRLPRGPRVLSLSYDISCNLRCPSCRSRVIMADREQMRRLEAIQDRVLATGLRHATELFLSGYGDPLASPVCKGLLRRLDRRDHPHLVVQLMTNGLLLDRKMWDSMSGISPAIHGVHVSIDAATPETYRVNRGGSFERLLENLSFLKSLADETGRPRLEVSFVVQANNFREMEAFVLLGKRLGARRVLFQRLIHWEAMSGAAHRAGAIHERVHPEFDALAEVLGSSLLRDEVVDLSNLSHLVARPAGQGAEDRR
jgi:sulfatase maturation enzyme AslB (radical SAM superfamily)